MTRCDNSSIVEPIVILIPRSKSTFLGLLRREEPGWPRACYGISKVIGAVALLSWIHLGALSSAKFRGWV